VRVGGRWQVIDWGIANTTLEEAFIKISKGPPPFFFFFFFITLKPTWVPRS